MRSWRGGVGFFSAQNNSRRESVKQNPAGFSALGCPLRQDVKRDRGGVRDVERGHIAARRQAAEKVAMLAGEAPEAAALGAQHQRDARRQVELGQGAFRLLLQPQAPEPGLFDLLQRPGKVGDAQERHLLERARGCLGQHAGHRRRAVLRHQHGQRAEGGGRAQDGADIVRVGHLVEHDNDLRRIILGQRCQKRIEIAFGQFLGGQRQALMHRARRQQPLEFAAVEHFKPGRRRLGARRRQKTPRLGGGLIEGDEAPADPRRIGERGFDRVAAIEPGKSRLSRGLARELARRRSRRPAWRTVRGPVLRPAWRLARGPVRGLPVPRVAGLMSLVGIIAIVAVHAGFAQVPQHRLWTRPDKAPPL